MRYLICLSCLLVAIGAYADSHEEKTYIYATYLNCDPMLEDGADKTFEEYHKSVYEASMKDGDITAWGYLKHHSGGNWRRLTYHMGTSVTGVLKSVEKIGETLDGKLESKDNGMAKACRSHDDYIWEVKQGNSTKERGKVGLSVYFVCDIAEERRADELVEREFAPVYDAHLGKGKLTSWGWYSHVLGGKYRRLVTTSAANLDDLFKARADILGNFAGSSAGREFNSICSTHTDYIWNIAMEGR